MPIIPTPAIPESKKSPSSLEHGTGAKQMARSGISWGFRWAWRYSEVCRGPEPVQRPKRSTSPAQVGTFEPECEAGTKGAMSFYQEPSKNLTSGGLTLRRPSFFATAFISGHCGEGG